VTALDLGDGLLFYRGRLPPELRWTPDTFAEVWDSRPATRPTIMLHGRGVQIPRWQ
jgi:hypothetical protein